MHRSNFRPLCTVRSRVYYCTSAPLWYKKPQSIAGHLTSFLDLFYTLHASLVFSYICKDLQNYIECPVGDWLRCALNLQYFDELLLLQYGIILSMKTIISYYLIELFVYIFYNFPI